MQITVHPLNLARKEHFRARRNGFRHTHAVQILDAEELHEAGQWPVVAPHSLRLVFEDLPDGPEHYQIPADYRGPSVGDMEKLIAFGRSLPADARVYLHCFAGVSRSPAAALIIQAARGVTDASALRFTDRNAYPNVVMLAMADRLLGSGGRLQQIGAALSFHSES